MRLFAPRFECRFLRRTDYGEGRLSSDRWLGGTYPELRNIDRVRCPAAAPVAGADCSAPFDTTRVRGSASQDGRQWSMEGYAKGDNSLADMGQSTLLRTRPMPKNCISYQMVYSPHAAWGE